MLMSAVNPQFAIRFVPTLMEAILAVVGQVISCRLIKCIVKVLNVIIIGHHIVTAIIFSDIDECNGVNDCQQQCNNTAGSYLCSCLEGFTLESDGRNCMGMPLYFSIIITILKCFLICSSKSM